MTREAEVSLIICVPLNKPFMSTVVIEQQFHIAKVPCRSDFIALLAIFRAGGGEHKSLLSHALTRHAYAIGREIRPEAQQPAATGRGARRLLELPRAPESGSSRGR
jgi:hypothetical protein